MRLPGLEEAMQHLDTLQDHMIPLLERIADGVDRLVELGEQEAEKWEG